MNTLDIMRYENGEMEFEEQVEFFQDLISDGTVWHLQGSYQRAALNLIEQGYCVDTE